MSAELLREAAERMRVQAEAATPGPWEHTPEAPPLTYVYPEGRVMSTAPGMDQQDPSVADTLMHCDSVHIASWHPLVALAVADLLIVAAVHVESHDCEAHCEPDGCASVVGALTVARAYLGRDQ